jgi:hypothetical protein
VSLCFLNHAACAAKKYIGGMYEKICSFGTDPAYCGGFGVRGGQQTERRRNG